MNIKIISYWKEVKEIHVDNGLRLIIGRYDHKNKTGKGKKALGIHWGDFPKSRGVLSPCVVPESTCNAILAGLLHQFVEQGDREKIETILNSIDFFNENNRQL